MIIQNDLKTVFDKISRALDMVKLNCFKIAASFFFRNKIAFTFFWKKKKRREGRFQEEVEPFGCVDS